jgi:hypothetical protein
MLQNNHQAETAIVCAQELTYELTYLVVFRLASIHHHATVAVCA